MNITFLLYILAHALFVSGRLVRWTETGASIENDSAPMPV